MVLGISLNAPLACRVTSAGVGAGVGGVIGGAVGSYQGGWEGAATGAAQGAAQGAIAGLIAGFLSPTACFVAGIAVVTGLRVEIIDPESGRPKIVTLTANQMAADGVEIATLGRIVGYVTTPIELLKAGDHVIARSEDDLHGPLVVRPIEEAFIRTPTNFVTSTSRRSMGNARPCKPPMNTRST